MRSIYVAGLGRGHGRQLIELGMMELLSRRAERVGVYRTITSSEDGGPDRNVELIRSRYRLAGYGIGATAQDAAQAHPDELIARLAKGCQDTGDGCDAMLVLGDARRDAAFNARLAAELDAPVVVVAGGRGRRADETASALREAWEVFTGHGCTVLALIANRMPQNVPVDPQAPVRCFVIPEKPSLAAPTVRQVAAAARATLVQGGDDGMQRDVLGFVFGGATLPVFLDHLKDGDMVVTPGDRADVLLGSLASDSAQVVRPAGVMLTLGEKPASNVRALTARLAPEMPVLSAGGDSFSVAALLAGLEGRITPGDHRKIEAALGHFAAHVDADTLAGHIEPARSERITSKMFEHMLVERGRAGRRHIVLPEGQEERVLRAADLVVRRGIAELTLLGPVEPIRRRIYALDLALHDVRVIDPLSSPLTSTFADRYALLHEDEGMTTRRAADLLGDHDFFGAMMVSSGMAHGMVSGVTHTTAATLTPAFQLIRPAGGRTAVSTVVFACLADRVVLFGDCSMIPEPDASQLADIAITSARTAERFGIEPVVAMLSYSSGPAGAGGDVERVRQAAEIARRRAPGLLVEGPMGYDAAIDPDAPPGAAAESPVAGRATVLIFPDLEICESACKAVRAFPEAMALGPVVQGLRQPVNDLPRDATVDDIVNMIAVTGIQAQGIEL
ncbi:phosphate acetyltransferase [Microtetraspora sp. NBRC 13810]|uniref:phosphate acetyltransferase n=1 Tax=Microtetraspora sp. NBRC 13810 TaxID=3030990 RepID=UPI0024A3C060|nr:phosphate acetyltransferase [Microtetraspora sp. NBRC 13810]GLW06056.1 phosphate acetyltransferase [Microtetraspora sp. NBRC 13810]